MTPDRGKFVCRVRSVTKTKFKTLLAASEVVGFAKTGGLADVCGSLPRALAQLGHDCAIITPLYSCTRQGNLQLTDLKRDFRVQLGERSILGRFCRATLPNSSIPVYLVEQPELFERDEPALGRGIYQLTQADGTKHDYPDNCTRFTFFCRAVIQAIAALDLWPDVLHLNDWQTGLIPVYLREVASKQGSFDQRTKYEHIRTLFTIHNIAYQGQFWRLDWPLLGLDSRLFNHRQLEFHDRINFLKGGIVFSDLINTVSPCYAMEIQTPYFGCGLEGVLIERRDRLFGIVNGADYDVWNPATDRHLAARYDETTIESGKPSCKKALQARMRLDVEPQTPLLGIVSRLVKQKGLDLVCEIAERAIKEGMQWVVLGEGDQVYVDQLQALRDRFPQRFGLRIGFDEALAHQIEAGADLFVMPSLYEPSGLNQLYSMKYGTVPVVRATGGLANTVVNCTPETLAAGTATGISFVSQYSGDLLAELRRAVAMFRGQPELFRKLMLNGMRQDWSWTRSAHEYEALFARLTARRVFRHS